MEELKKWIASHRALAIGGGIALAILLYLWLKSGSSASASSSNGLNAYYAAQSAAAGDTAYTTNSTNALDASTAATNAQEAVDLAAIKAEAVPYTDYLTAQTNANNLTAYKDYLAEGTGGGTSSSAQGVGGYNYNAAEFVGAGGDKYIQSVAQVLAGNTNTFYDATTGVGGFSAAAAGVIGAPSTVGNFDVSTNTFTPLTSAAPAMTFAQFVGSSLNPTLTTPATTTTTTTPAH